MQQILIQSFYAYFPKSHSLKTSPIPLCSTGTKIRKISLSSHPSSYLSKWSWHVCVVVIRSIQVMPKTVQNHCPQVQATRLWAHKSQSTWNDSRDVSLSPHSLYSCNTNILNTFPSCYPKNKGHLWSSSKISNSDLVNSSSDIISWEVFAETSFSLKASHLNPAFPTQSAWTP